MLQGSSTSLIGLACHNARNLAAVLCTVSHGDLLCEKTFAEPFAGSLESARNANFYNRRCLCPLMPRGPPDQTQRWSAIFWRVQARVPIAGKPPRNYFPYQKGRKLFNCWYKWSGRVAQIILLRFWADACGFSIDTLALPARWGAFAEFGHNTFARGVVPHKLWTWISNFFIFSLGFGDQDP